MAPDGPAQLRIQLAAGSDEVRVRVSGEVDISVADQLSHVLDGLPPEQHVIIDFADVTFCDCSGIRAMVDLRHQQSLAGHTLSLVNTSADVRRIFELAGLVDFLDMP